MGDIDTQLLDHQVDHWKLLDHHIDHIQLLNYHTGHVLLLDYHTDHVKLLDYHPDHVQLHDYHTDHLQLLNQHTDHVNLLGYSACLFKHPENHATGKNTRQSKVPWTSCGLDESHMPTWGPWWHLIHVVFQRFFKARILVQKLQQARKLV